MSAKQYGTTWVYPALDCWTGSLSAQPHNEAIGIERCCDFTPDYKVMFDQRGALDAPERIPSGSVRAQDFEVPSGAGRILVGHVYRPRYHW